MNKDHFKAKVEFIVQYVPLRNFKVPYEWEIILTSAKEVDR